MQKNVPRVFKGMFMKMFFNAIPLMLISYIALRTREQDIITFIDKYRVLIEGVCINTHITPTYTRAHVHAFLCSWMKESEKEIERELARGARKLEGDAYKLNSSSLAGLPDRLVLLPFGKIAFVELKAPGKKPRKLQMIIHERLRSLGFKVYVVDSREKAREVLDEIYTS